MQLGHSSLLSSDNGNHRGSLAITLLGGNKVTLPSSQRWCHREPSGKSGLPPPAPRGHKATVSEGINESQVGSNNEALLPLPAREVSVMAYWGARIPTPTQQ